MATVSLFTKEKQVQASFITAATVPASAIGPKPSSVFCWKASMKAGMLFTPTHSPFHPISDKVRNHVKVLVQH